MKYFVEEWKNPLLIMMRIITNDGERGRHGLPNSRTTTFRCEIRAKCQRSTIDSENWEPSRSTCSSTRSTTESIIWSLQSRIKTNDSWSWEHRTVRITRDGTQNAVHSMYIIVEHWYILLHVRAFLAQRKRGKSTIHQWDDGPSFSSRVRHQERTTSWTSIW